MNFIKQNGWLSPDGNFYECKFGKHRFWAEENQNTKEDILEMHRWIKLSEGSFIKNITFMKWRLTESQIEWMNKNGYENYVKEEEGC